MAYATIIYTVKEHVARIVLNRPEANNLVSRQLAQELADVCDEIGRDEDVNVVIITGAGDKAFCGGAEGPSAGGGIYGIAAPVAGISQPVIAAINGDALGQGLELALSCDIRVASRRARLGFPQVAQGLIPMDGGTQRLPRLVGRGKALELVLTAETISAQEAYEIGLVDKLADAELAAEVEAMARAVAGKGPIAVRYVKEAVNKGLDLTLEQGLRLEADIYFLLHTTADRTEGISAFRQKRPPRFKGK
ncbi:MAG: enoyl-CoA hydratase-related protein [Chloroflexota bacterium]